MKLTPMAGKNRAWLKLALGLPQQAPMPTCAWPHELGQPVTCTRTGRGRLSCASSFSISCAQSVGGSGVGVGTSWDSGLVIMFCPGILCMWGARSARVNPGSPVLRATWSLRAQSRRTGCLCRTPCRGSGFLQAACREMEGDLRSRDGVCAWPAVAHGPFKRPLDTSCLHLPGLALPRALSSALRSTHLG